MEQHIHKITFLFLDSVLPPSSPSIQTSQLYYTPGDVLRANCTSGPSRPASEIALFINDMPVSIIIVPKIVITKFFLIVVVIIIFCLKRSCFGRNEQQRFKIFRI